MNSSEWLDLFQALVLAACTWYVRRSSTKDTEQVLLNTSSVDQVRRLQAEIALIRDDLGKLKDHYFKNNPVIDDRGPGILD